jgi:hypothetical protein
MKSASYFWLTSFILEGLLFRTRVNSSESFYDEKEEHYIGSSTNEPR